MQKTLPHVVSKSQSLITLYPGPRPQEALKERKRVKDGGSQPAVVGFLLPPDCSTAQPPDMLGLDTLANSRGHMPSAQGAGSREYMPCPAGRAHLSYGPGISHC